MLTTWLDGLKHVEAVEADPRVCYDSCCFQKMVLRKHWSIAIPRNPNIIPQNQKIKRHQKTSKDKNSAATTANGAPIRESLQVLCLGQCFGSFGHGLTAWLAMAKYVRWKNCGNCGNCHNLRCLWSHGPRHLDDFAESFLMSAFRNGSLRTMKAQIRQRHWTSWTADMWCYVMLCDVGICVHWIAHSILMRLASFSIKVDGWKAVFQSMLLQANYAVAAKDLRVCRPLVNVREKTLANFAKENRHEVYG